MTILAEQIDAVVGGDTHRDTHTLEMVAPNGVTLASSQVRNDDGGYADALAWIAENAPGPRVAASLEGTRSYGVGMARAFQAAGILVLEAAQPRRAQHRTGKSDPIDAHLAAIAALRVDAGKLPTPRADGDREALRILLGARQELTTTDTRLINRLRALLLTGDQADRELARGRLNLHQLASIARRRGKPDDDNERSIRLIEARRLAIGIRDTQRALAANNQQLGVLVADLAPTIQSRIGIGPVSAAQAIVSWSHPGRCRSEAAYAALAGVNPVPASSGRTTRHRLNRGGDRALNSALHNITITRWRCCPRTKSYIAKRRAEGKSDREIRRCLKRYIAREIYRALNAEIVPIT